jgi:hypothetical protein
MKCLSKDKIATNLLIDQTGFYQQLVKFEAASILQSRMRAPTEQ